MTPDEIQTALDQRNITQAKIAEKLAVTPMNVSLVVNGKSRSDRVMTAVAKALDMSKEQVFPDYYLGPKLRCTSKAMGKSHRAIRQ